MSFKHAQRFRQHCHCAFHLDVRTAHSGRTSLHLRISALKHIMHKIGWKVNSKTCKRSHILRWKCRDLNKGACTQTFLVKSCLHRFTGMPAVPYWPHCIGGTWNAFSYRSGLRVFVSTRLKLTRPTLASEGARVRVHPPTSLRNSMKHWITGRKNTAGATNLSGLLSWRRR